MSDLPAVREWTTRAGLDAKITRVSLPRFSHSTLPPWWYCGYVSRPYCVPSSCDLEELVNVHGGVTYDRLGWVGFDCAHFGDVDNGWQNIEQVADECERLADQLVELATSFTGENA